MNGEYEYKYSYFCTCHDAMQLTRKWQIVWIAVNQAYKIQKISSSNDTLLYHYLTR